MKVEVVSVNDIDLGERRRKDYGDIKELVHSIETKGLMTPLAVSPHNNGSHKYLLIAGGRRLTAMQSAIKTDNFDPNQVPVRIFERDLTDRQFRVLELEENVKRKDLNYMEQIEMEKEIHDLMVAEKGAKSLNPGSAEAEGHSLSDTAKMLKVDPSKISKDFKLLEAAKLFPELDLGNCKNANEAHKLANSMSHAIIRNDQARKAEKRLGKADKLKKKLIENYVLNDFFEGVAGLPNNCVDLVEVDPPYAINLDKQKKDGDCSGYKEVSSNDYSEFLSHTFRECYRVMKEDSWILCWHAHQWNSQIKQWLKSAGFHVNEIPLIWTKRNGQNNNPTKQLSNAYELCAYACKGNPKLNIMGQTNVFAYPGAKKAIKFHPAQRPLELMVDILSIFAVENSQILVPFLGSGNTIIAAAVAKMGAFGYELTPEYRDNYILMLERYFENGTLR